MSDDELKRRMLAWHRAVVYWTMSFGELPDWASDIGLRDATLDDAKRLERETDHRYLFGTGEGTPVGIIDYARAES